jgi:hypothetical protein
MASATTELDVVNRALTKLGEPEITTLAGSDKQNRVMRGIVDPVRDRFLREGVWNPTVERATLAKDTVAPNHGWDSRHLLPSDFIKMVSVESTTGNARIGKQGSMPESIEYRIEGGYVMNDESGSVQIIYVKRLEDMSRYDSSMTEALATLYAHEACMSLVQDSGLRDRLLQEYHFQLKSALKHDGWEDGYYKLPVDDYIAMR